MKSKFFLAGLMALVLVSCQDNTPCKYHSMTIDLIAKQADWEFDKDEQLFYCSFNVPEITNHVYNYGNWTICREYNAGSKNAYQVALPSSEFMTDTLNNGTVEYYTRYTDYRLGVGGVDIQVTNSDYLYSSQKPEDMIFRLQLIY